MSDLGDGLLTRVRDAFAKAEIVPVNLEIRQFPGETIIVVEVAPNSFAAALTVASDLDSQIEDGFITVRKAALQKPKGSYGAARSLVDARVSVLLELLNAHSRTSEQQPSLHYIRDAAQNLNIAVSRRHHLIFGRRGVGKTALMLEAKKHLDNKGAITFWANVQPLRSLSAHEAFLTLAIRLCDLPETVHAGRTKRPLSIERAQGLRSRMLSILDAGNVKGADVNVIVPQLQQLFQLFGQETQTDLYIFLDDMHYLAIKEQPVFLDMAHSITRDNPIWIKIAGIRHQSRWFTDNPPIGLQTGHDAAIINLDITLEQPAKAKEFLTSILRSYTEEARLGSISGAISRAALDRLVLASGGVPRDFLVLSATAIQVARQRTNAKTAGVQDVNEAAGRNAQPKLQELEDDAASALGRAEARIDALSRLRGFLLDARQTTYFRVDFRDKEAHPKEYELMQSLMDLRLIHLINSGLSDEREAGRKAEVYMLDLSQFSGTRFKRNLKVLDFIGDHLVLKSTGGGAPTRVGDTPNKLLSILRRGPAFGLTELTACTAVIQ